MSTALLGKHITAGFQVPANILPYANSGDFNVIAISRKDAAPDRPIRQPSANCTPTR